MREAADDHPVVRDYDSHMFCVTRNKQFMVGGFEPRAKPAFSDGIPRHWRNSLTGDEEHFSKLKCLFVDLLLIIYIINLIDYHHHHYDALMKACIFPFVAF